MEFQQASENKTQDEEQGGAEGEKDTVSVSDSSVDSDDDSDSASWTAEERLARAESFKNAGNEFFKQQDNKSAAGRYGRALKILNPIHDLKPPVLMEPIKVNLVGLVVTLQLNKAIAELKLEKWSEAVGSSSAALEEMEKSAPFFKSREDADKSRSKGLFRRAQARKRLGDLEGAREDLVSLLKIEKTNQEALREYAQVKKEILAYKESEKKAFSAVFDKVSKSGGMYADKEAERKRAALRKIDQEKKRREQWTREEADKAEKMTFEDWCKMDDERTKERNDKEAAEKKAKEEQEEKERREKRELERLRREAERAEKAKQGDPESDLDLDEEDLKAIQETKKKGYCYFRTSHTDEEKALLASSGHSKPARIDSSASAAADEVPAASAWNANGTTWEERDISSAAKDLLKSKLQSIQGSLSLADGSSGSYVVNSVEKVDGNAQIVITRAKPAPVYDMSAKLKWKVVIGGVDHIGSCHMPHLYTGMVAEEMEIKTKHKSDANNPQLLEVLEGLYGHLRSSMTCFVTELLTK